MKARHSMPFGAELCEDGKVRFRLWAPAARQVDVCLHDDGTLHAMQAVGTGWWELVTAAARTGSRYRYRIDGEQDVPDPASRFNPQDVHGPSQVWDSHAFAWDMLGWRGRPWHEAVVYELHVGTFTPQGTYAGVEERLDYLAGLGVTAIELMPVADFPGRRSWGYDGVLPFAPDAAYGTPDELKHLIQAAHRKRIMVLLDVVYNHFGPDGNYLHRYAPQFFTERHHTPWGAAINFDAAEAQPVREFFIHNALYWLEEFRFDGLRLDAVHAIIDTSQPSIVDELARRVRLGPGREREVHIVLENEHNCARHLEREAGGQPHCDAQWNDDAHHAAHVLLTGETDGYYIDYAQKPAWWLARCLAEGFAYQGEASTLRKGEHRGEVSAQLPPTAFVNFIQNHDQIGNRAFGERLAALAPEPALRAMAAVYLLAPSIPMLFMGEEFGATSPFLYFCDHHDQLADAVREGRRREFAHFPRFADPAVRESIPDPNDIATFRRSTLDWNLLHDDAHWDWQRYYRQLLALREREIVPALAGMRGGSGAFDMIGPRAFNVRWLLGDGSRLELLANLDPQPVPPVARPSGEALFLLADPAAPAEQANGLAGWSVLWLIDRDIVQSPS